MQFSNDEMKAFKELWLTEFGESLDDIRAPKEAGRLLALMKFATDPIPKTLDPPDEKSK